MSDPLKMLPQASLWDTPSVTSSPGSEVGHSPCGSQESQTTFLYGLDHAHANLSPRQAKEKGLLMSGTCGPRSTGTFTMQGPNGSLASKYQAVTESLGSGLYLMTWKPVAMSPRHWIFRLAASVHRIVETESIGQGPWGATSASDWQQTSPGMSSPEGRLKHQVSFCGWPKTPSASDGEGGVMEVIEGKDGKYKLRDYAQLVDFGKDAIGYLLGPNGWVECQALGQLNPEFSLWLMGYPTEWHSCGVRAMQSSPSKRRRSSRR